MVLKLTAVSPRGSQRADLAVAPSRYPQVGMADWVTAFIARSRADIPPFFTNAILASEDKNFFTHEGIDKGAIVRALAKRILQESRSGASTLTMQIAKHLREGTGRPSTETEKIGDIVMALRIEREFSRQQLLLKYVNMPYFGRGQYGIEAASCAYFGKPAKDLALHQSLGRGRGVKKIENFHSGRSRMYLRISTRRC